MNKRKTLTPRPAPAPTPYIDPALAEQETSQQRIRRRLQQRRCANCGTPNRRQGRANLCKACEEQGLQYCCLCEQVLTSDYFWSRRASHCTPCNGTRLGRKVGSRKQWQPGQPWNSRTKAVRDAEGWRVLKLLSVGATWEQVAEQMGETVSVIRQRHYRWIKKQKASEQ